MGERNDHSRRDFLESLGIGTAGLAVGGYAATARGYAKNETIGIGVIGTGGRARKRLMPALKRIPGVQINAVCDVYDDHLDAGHYVAGGRDREVFRTGKHEELLARGDVDAVVIATPDHWHVPMSVYACEAGKDVYVEKPLTHDLEEGRSLIEARDRHKRVVQVGTQQRSMTHIIEAKKRIVDRGLLGKVRKVREHWNRHRTHYNKPRFNIKRSQVDWERFLGNAPDQPFDPFRMRQWRWIWDFGGGILTDLMVHWHDVTNMMLGLGTPAEVTTIGSHYMTEGIWETPDTVNTLVRYGEEGVQTQFEGTIVNNYEPAGMLLEGTEATLYIDRGRYELHPARGSDVRFTARILGQGPRGANFYDQPHGEILHLSDWLEAVRARRQPSAPVEAGVLGAAVAHYGNMAYREGRVVRPGEG